MKKRWTRFHKHVVKNYANHGHSNGRDRDGETIPAFVRPLHDYILRNKPTGTVSRQEKEKVDGRIMPRQRPLGDNVMAEPRSERLDVNVRNGITNVQPNQDVENNRAVPVNVDIEARTIRADDTRGGDDARQPPKKRRRNRYHDAIFGADNEDDNLRNELSVSTSAVTKMIAAQQRQMQAEQSNAALLQYEHAKEKLQIATDPDDIRVYTIAKNRAMRMMTTLDANEA